jgi:SAM-dependent methyltransferase
MLDQARPKARLASFELLRADAESLPFINSRFDLVALSLVYHHLRHPAAALAQIARVLRPSGIAYIRTPTVETMHSSTWDCFFPSARRIAAETLPTTERVLAEAQRAGFLIAGHHTLRFLFARTGQQLLERLSRRAISSLRQISSKEFEAGLTALKARCLAGSDQKPIFDELGIFVLRRP